MEDKKKSVKYVIRGCIGCSVCANIAPKVFKMNEDGLAEIIDKTADPDEIEEISEQCPAQAIIIEK